MNLTYFQPRKRRNVENNNYPLNIRFVTKTLDIRNFSQNIRSYVKTSEVATLATIICGILNHSQGNFVTEIKQISCSCPDPKFFKNKCPNPILIRKNRRYPAGYSMLFLSMLTSSTCQSRLTECSPEMSMDQVWIGLDQDLSQFWPDQDWIGLQFISKLADMTVSDWENLLFWFDYSNHVKNVSCNVILQIGG